MSQVGVAACPKCGARYGVQESVAGQMLPCPACGTKFVVQPVARAADDFLPPSVDLAAGGPIVPVSRVLDPKVYPHRDIPWALIAIVMGLCLVLGLILFGGWHAYRAIDAAMASASIEQGELTSSAATEAATGAATDVADQVAADATAAVQRAGKVIDRIAGTVTDSIDVPKILPDSHERLADERDRLQADYRRIRDGFVQGKPGETVGKLIDLQLRTGDLSIRWSLLAPMTASELDRLKPRLAESLKLGIGGQPIEEADPAFRSEPWVAATAAELNNAWKGIPLAISLSVEPPQPQTPPEQKCAELAAGSREVCKQLFSVRSVAELDRVTPTIQAEIEHLRTPGPLAGAGIVSTEAPVVPHISRVLSQTIMVTYVGKHVVLRFARERVDPAAAEEDKLKENDEVKDFGIRLGKLLAEYEVAHFALVQATMQPRLPEGKPTVATSVTPEGGPTINLPGFGGPFGIPPGFGPPGGLGPPPGFGPPAGFGGPAAGPRADESIDAEFETKRQAFAQANGADRIVTVRASGGSPTQFRGLELTLMRLIRPTSHSMHSIGTRFQMSVVFSGDVERVANAITTGKIVSTDVTSRMIVVEFKQ